MRLEIVVLPVSDVDQAKAFYRAAGFREDLDYAFGEGFRVVRFTPPGSAASIVFGRGITAAGPGTAQGLHLVVPVIDSAIAALRDAGIEVTGAFHDIGGVFYHDSPEFEVPGSDPARRDGATFARFRDPDGNGWILQGSGAPDRP
jgi:catechol 2,3-dioxygenase-like lactoylglutathione lyase family enzyme